MKNNELTNAFKNALEDLIARAECFVIDKIPNEEILNPRLLLELYIKQAKSYIGSKKADINFARAFYDFLGLTIEGYNRELRRAEFDKEWQELKKKIHHE